MSKRPPPPMARARPAARDRLEAEAVRRALGDDAHPRAAIDDEAQRLLRAVDAHADDGPVVDQLERHHDARRAVDADEVFLRAEVAEEVDEAADAVAAVGVRARGDAQELLVGVGRLGVPLEPRRHLPEVEDVVRLVGLQVRGAAQAFEAGAQAVLVKVHHRHPADGHRLVAVEAEGRAELLDREAEVARGEERRPEQRVRARRHRLHGDDARRLVVRVARLPLLQQRVAEAEARRHVLRVFRQHLAENLLRRLELAAAQRALAARPRLRVAAGQRRARRRAHQRRAKADGGHHADRRTEESVHGINS